MPLRTYRGIANQVAKNRYRYAIPGSPRRGGAMARADSTIHLQPGPSRRGSSSCQRNKAGTAPEEGGTEVQASRSQGSKSGRGQDYLIVQARSVLRQPYSALWKLNDKTGRMFRPLGVRCSSGDQDTVLKASLDWLDYCCAGIEVLSYTDVDVMSMSWTISKSAPPTEYLLTRSS